MSTTVELTDGQVKRIAYLRERQRRLNSDLTHADEMTSSAKQRADEIVREINACFDEIKQIESGMVVVPRSLVAALGEFVDIIENAADYLLTHEGGGYPAETVAWVKSWFAEEYKKIS